MSNRVSTHLYEQKEVVFAAIAIPKREVESPQRCLPFILTYECERKGNVTNGGWLNFQGLKNPIEHERMATLLRTYLGSVVDG